MSVEKGMQSLLRTKGSRGMTHGLVGSVDTKRQTSPATDETTAAPVEVDEREKELRMASAAEKLGAVSLHSSRIITPPHQGSEEYLG